MRPSAKKLSQPTAVSAYIYILLIVMNFGLAWSNEKNYYFIIHDATQGRLNMQNRTVGIDINNKTQEKFHRLIISSDEHFNLTFYNEASRRFLCFEWKAKKKSYRLVGIRNPKDCSRCMFKEILQNGYHRYFHVDQQKRRTLYLSFSLNGNFSNKTKHSKFIKKEVTVKNQNDTAIKLRHGHHDQARKCINRERKKKNALRRHGN